MRLPTPQWPFPHQYCRRLKKKGQILFIEFLYMTIILFFRGRMISQVFRRKRSCADSVGMNNSTNVRTISLGLGLRLCPIWFNRKIVWGKVSGLGLKPCPTSFNLTLLMFWVSSWKKQRRGIENGRNNSILKLGLGLRLCHTYFSLSLLIFWVSSRKDRLIAIGIGRNNRIRGRILKLE